MRILFSGAFNPRFEALPEGVAAGFRRAGHDVVCFNHRDFRIPGRLRDRIASLDRLERAGLNRRLLRAARRFRPHLLLVNQGSVVTPATVKTVRRETGAVAANWWSDYPAEFEIGLDLARGRTYELFYVSGTDAERRHHAAGVSTTRWLPFACDPDVHRPVPLTPRERTRYASRIAFVGSAYAERRDLLSRLTDLGLAIWGPGWERYRDDPRVGPCIRGGALGPGEWTRVFAAADVVLNISYGLGGPAEAYGTLANVRVFEALACGSCQVVDAKRDVLSLFGTGEHLAVFRTAEEARQLIVDLLRDPGRRAALAEAGRREVLARHTWSHRVESIVGDMEDLTRAGAKRAAS